MSHFEPGRSDAGRSVPASSFCHPRFRRPLFAGQRRGLGRRTPGTLASLATLLLGILLLAGCESSGATPHPNLRRVWKDFLELPRERALAIAGDPRRNHWISDASAGHRTRDEATAAALEECARHRQLRRMQAPCEIYGVDDEIVWHRDEDD